MLRDVRRRDRELRAARLAAIEVRLPIDKVDYQVQVRWSEPGGNG